MDASPRLRERARDLARNFPPFARAVKGYAAFVWGRGPRFQSLAVLPDGSPNKQTRRRTIDQRFRDWMENDADAAGRQHFYELGELVCRQLMESGEGLLLEKTRQSYAVNPYSLLPLESDRLSDQGPQPSLEGSAKFGGIE